MVPKFYHPVFSTFRGALNRMDFELDDDRTAALAGELGEAIKIHMITDITWGDESRCEGTTFISSENDNSGSLICLGFIEFFQISAEGQRALRPFS
ncbi:hypothetical protein SCP_1003080 [Sparassis crispa]|uniref:Uncharacterized protein n=1 Tax=Sparassis crispa TaxID=139825 RepID=A0A401GXY7_9APHY|nr:hypothetical protein SCP_1003080 [Sparassis crispa]GBE87061.1 hypothetical protein SCP_1003080 [Sparassis crispa]